MAHYLVLYHDGQISEDNEAELSTWIREIGNSVVDSGSSLTEGLRIEEGKSQPIENLPCTNYIIFDSATQDEAIELARSYPGLAPQDNVDIYKLND